jgi:carbon starvation protein
MNVLIPLLLGLGLLFLATRTYPFYLSRKLGVNDAVPTPAHRHTDGRDYVPTRTHVVFAHHFSVIAGAGPIVGPTLALAYGWAPTAFWIVLGCIFFGAAHDMASMFVSMREDGRSIADMARRSLGGAGYLFFLVFLVMILTLINAIFLNLSCKALTASYPASLLKLETGTRLLHTFTDPQGVLMGRIGGIATTSVFVITAFAPLIGWLTYKRRWHTGVLYILAAVICALSVLFGFYHPILLEEGTWRYTMSLYCFFACWLPVWLVLQPRDFVNVQILYGGLIVMVVGLVYYGFAGRPLSAEAFAVAEGAKLSGGPIWPFLFITVACGAISGFHSLAATGTTVKQISKESEVRRVGYNAMILEGALALLTLVLIGAALPRAEYLNIVYPAVMKDSNPVLAFSVAMGYLLNQMIGLKVAIGCVIGILVLEGFVVTTLDTAVRLCRYMLEEFWSYLFRGRQPVFMKNPFFNTLIAVALMLFFALNSTIMSAWKIFGAGNQLIAALAMTVVTVWLLQRGRSFWFTVIPAVLMTVTTFATLIISIRKNLAAAASGHWVAEGQGPLTFAAVLLLVLAVGVIFVSAKKFMQVRSARRVAANAVPA